jgi:hypothetical protein
MHIVIDASTQNLGVEESHKTDVDDVDLDLGNGMQKEMMMGSEQQKTRKNNHLVVYRRWKAYIEVG